MSDQKNVIEIEVSANSEWTSKREFPVNLHFSASHDLIDAVIGSRAYSESLNALDEAQFKTESDIDLIIQFKSRVAIFTFLNNLQDDINADFIPSISAIMDNVESITDFLPDNKLQRVA